MGESRQPRSRRRWLVWAALGTALVVGGVVGGVIVGATRSSGSSVGAAASGSSATASACPVTPGGPAATAGLRPEDVITKIDGEPATSNLQLQELTLTKKPGDTVSIDYTRDGQSATATVTLAPQP